MKKTKLKLFGIIAAVAIVGLSMISCGNNCGNDGNCFRGEDGSASTCGSADCNVHMGDGPMNNCNC